MRKYRDKDCVVCKTTFTPTNSTHKTCSTKCSKSLGNKRRGKSDKKYNTKCKDLVFTHYGMVCACCGESNMIFLTIDHIGNDGASERRSNNYPRGYGFYRWLIKNNYPTGYRTLCYNCNCGRAHNNGVCPHVQT